MSNKPKCVSAQFLFDDKSTITWRPTMALSEGSKPKPIWDIIIHIRIGLGIENLRSFDTTTTAAPSITAALAFIRLARKEFTINPKP